MASVAKYRNQALAFMLIWVVLASGTFRLFQRQLEATQRARWPSKSANINMQQSRPLKRLARFTRLAELHFKLLFGLYCFEFFRLILIQAVSADALRDYHFLDCLIVGRFRLVGRLNQIGGRILLAFIGVFVIYHWLYFIIVPAQVEFYALELLFEDETQVQLANEAATALQQSPGLDYLKRQPSRGGHLQPGHKTRSANHLKFAGLPNRVYYIKNPFELYDDDDDDDDKSEAFEDSKGNANEDGEWILRANRTCDSWHSMRQFTWIMIVVTIASFLVWLAWIARVLSGSLLTNTGFELSYPTCTSWAQRQQRLQASAANSSVNLVWDVNFETFHTPSREVLAHQLNRDKLPAIIPLNESDLRPLSLYTIYHVGADLITNTLWYCEFMTIIICESYMTFLITLDIYLNTNAISRRLNGVIRQLEILNQQKSCNDSQQQQIDDELSLATPSTNLSHSEHRGTLSFISKNAQQLFRHPSRFLSSRQLIERARELDPTAAALREEIRQLQAILVDHFTMVKGYNRFVSVQAILIIATWCAESGVLSGFMITTRNRALEFEFLVTEIGGTYFVMLFFACAAITRTLNYRLHRLLTSVMALDDHRSSTKLRWLTILRYYRPKPMFCFTLMGSIELSLMFCLKFVWWAVSVFVVLANFFYSHR